MIWFFSIYFLLFFIHTFVPLSYVTYLMAFWFSCCICPGFYFLHSQRKPFAIHRELNTVHVIWSYNGNCIINLWNQLFLSYRLTSSWNITPVPDKHHMLLIETKCIIFRSKIRRSMQFYKTKIVFPLIWNKVYKKKNMGLINWKFWLGTHSILPKIL